MSKTARTEALEQALGMAPGILTPHIRAIPSPAFGSSLKHWPACEIMQEIHGIFDGFSLFSPGPPFTVFGKKDYSQHKGTQIHDDALRLGLLPICGEGPHLTSIDTNTGAVVATDWECFDDPENGWLTPIANDFAEFIRTIVTVRKAYGDPPDAWPSDWWSPYASTGQRYDLNEGDASGG